MVSDGKGMKRKSRLANKDDWYKAYDWTFVVSCTNSSVTRTNKSLYGDSGRGLRTLGHTKTWSNDENNNIKDENSFHDAGPVYYAARAGLEDQLGYAIELKVSPQTFERFCVLKGTVKENWTWWR